LMPIDPFSLKGIGEHLFPELERLNKLIPGVNAMSKLYPAMPETKRFRDATVGVDLAQFRGIFSDPARLTSLQSEQLHLAASGGDRLRAMAAVTGTDLFSRIAGGLGSGLHEAALSSAYSEVLRHYALMDEGLSAIRGTAFHDAALRSADLASTFKLPGFLDAHRIGTDIFADRLAIAGLTGSVLPGQWKDPGFLSAFSSAAAMANVMAASTMMNAEIQGMTRSLAAAGIPGNLGLQAYRGVLDAAGLVLPRWPSVRRLSPKEQDERQEKRLRRYRQPPHVGKAKSLVHQYERYLREIIDELMAAEYGEDWPEARLTVCAEEPVCRGDARKLLSVWHCEGGNVLDHADYVHYRMIMVQRDHFSAIFSFGFGDDPETVRVLIAEARKLRAASHHAREDFTPQDLQDLRVTWNAIALGLKKLTLGTEVFFESA